MAMGQRVLEKIAIKHRNVREGIGEIMGGKVLDYEAKDILNEGIRQGCIQGEEREKIQIAERMLQRNMSVEEIAVCTELTVEQVQELKCK